MKNLPLRYPGLLTAVGLLVGSWAAPSVGAQEAAVHALLFYSPTCPHCHEVMTRSLPPLIDRYGDQLQILAINTTERGGANLYLAVADHYQVPQENRAVPLMVVGDEVLIGSVEIPARLPGIIDEGLPRGGIDWPPVPTVLEALEANGIIDSAEAVLRRAEARAAGEEVVVDTGATGVLPDTTGGEAPGDTVPARPVGEGAPGARPDPEIEAPTTPEADTQAIEAEAAPERTGEGDPTERETGREDTDSASSGLPEADSTASESGPTGIVGSVEEAAAEIAEMSMADRFALDRAGNTAAVVVLAWMLVVLVLVVRGFLRLDSSLRPWPVWSMPLFIAVGTVVAVYLSYVEITNTEAVCGPVGHCNEVQQSPYATLFGFLPVGVLGILGYIGMTFAWLLSRSESESVRDRGSLSLWGIALLGTLFSLYLTFLEPFVIGASCAWCLTSAVATTLILRASAPAAIAARRTLRA